MSELKIIPIESKGKELSRFIHFAWGIYQGDPYWVPPLIADQKKLLNADKNPFFLHSEAQLFLACRGDKIVGRIAASTNTQHLKTYKENVGFFGFFESVDEPEVAARLLGAAEEWGRQRGCTAIRGPFNLTINDECGCLVEGFDSSPYVMMTYNPRYYPRLYEGAGCQKCMDLYAYYAQAPHGPTEELQKTAKQVQQQLAVSIRPLDLKNRFDEELAIFQQIYNDSRIQTWGFVPLTHEESRFKANDLKSVISPELCFFLYAKEKPVGFAFGLPNYNEALKRINGRLFPFGLFKLLYYSRKIKTVRVIQLGMIQEYQNTGLGVYSYVELMNRAAKLGIRQGEMSWVLENNSRMNKAAQLLGGRRYKTYRIYEKKIIR